MKRIIEAKKSIIVATDVRNFDQLRQLVEAVSNVKGIGGFKVPGYLGLRGLFSAVQLVRNVNGNSRIPIIFDYQKGGNDIPEMGKNFAEEVKEAGADAVILFPFAGPATQKAWTIACHEVNLPVLIGGLMTHPNFLASEGGYITDEAPSQIFELACDTGVRHFVLPGNKPGKATELKKLLSRNLGSDFVPYSPDFINQHGDITRFAEQVGGDEWHAIIGSAIYGKDTFNTPEQMRQIAVNLTRQIRGL